MSFQLQIYCGKIEAMNKYTYRILGLSICYCGEIDPSYCWSMVDDYCRPLQREAVTLQLVDKDNRYVCVCRKSSSEQRFGIHTMLKDAATLTCPDWAWLSRSCLAGTVVSWLVPVRMVQWRVRARMRAERRYRLLSCPGSAAARGSPCSGAASAGRSRMISQATYCSSSSNKQQSSYIKGAASSRSSNNSSTAVLQQWTVVTCSTS